MKGRVLVVDDDGPVRQSIQEVLEECGYQVVSAPDGTCVEAHCDASHIDLAILDLNLPQESGWDVFERLTTRFPQIPVIIISGLTDQYPMAQAAGASALLEKPLEATTLISTIAELLAEPPEKRLLRMCGYRSDTRHLHSRGGGNYRDSSQVSWRRSRGNSQDW